MSKYPRELVVYNSIIKMKIINSHQEPITRSVQLNYVRAAAFSQVRLFLDTPFPPKITVSSYLHIEI